MRMGIYQINKTSGPMTKTKKVALGVVGVILIGVSAAISFSKYQFINRATKAEGTIINIVERRSSDSNNSTYAPVVTFRTNNLEHTFTSSVSTSSRPLIGEKVTVLYDPADPNDAAIDSVTTLWFFPLIVGFMGLIFLMIGIFSKIKPLGPTLNTTNISGLGGVQQFTGPAGESAFVAVVNQINQDRLPPELAAYLQNAFAAGQKEHEIRDALKKAGWKQEDIDRSLRG